MKQANLYARNGNCYLGKNLFVLAQAAQGRVGLWLTRNQVENEKGKYLFNGLRLAEGAMPETITKVDRMTGEPMETEVFNIEDTNFKERYPRVYANLKRGMTVDQSIEAALSEPLMERAMKTAQTPTSFWKKIAAAVFAI